MEIDLKLGQFCGLSRGILPSAFQGRQFLPGVGCRRIGHIHEENKKICMLPFKIKASITPGFCPSKLISEQHLFTGQIENCV
jgi:hypothetical protein